MATKQLELDDIEVGMFICELDIPWLESPFLNPYRHVKNINDIDLLRECGVQTVVIDLAKSTHEQTTAEASPPSQAVRAAPSETVSREMKAATKVRDRCRQAINEFNQDLQKGNALKVDNLNPLIDQTVDSLTRNSQALMTLLHMNHKASRLADHGFSVMCMALNIALELGLDKQSSEQLSMAGLLHDSGWQKLPLNLIGKRSRYTVSESKLVQQHIKIGVELLKKANIDAVTLRLILEHHERGDGTGYPRGIKAADMHTLSHILTAVVYYDEQVHQMNDDAGQTPTGTLQTMYALAQRGRFDLKVVTTMVHLLGVYPISTAVLLNSGEKGVVIEQNNGQPSKPIVRVYYDSNAKLLADSKELDLVAVGKTIVSVLDANNPQIDPARVLHLA